MKWGGETVILSWESRFGGGEKNYFELLNQYEI